MARLRKRNGVYQAIFYDRNGIRRFKSTHLADKRAADALARRFEREAHDPDLAAQENPTTLGQALELLIEHYAELVKAGRKAEGTLSMHRDKAASLRFVLEADGPFRLAHLAATDVDALISQRRQDGAKENTIAKELVTLRSALKLALRHGLWRGDVKAILPIAFAPEYKPRERFLTREELTALLPRLTQDHAARLAFEVATSANLGEADRAMREDVSATAVYIRGTKRTSRKRTVPMVTDWQRELIAYVIENAQGVDGRLFRFDSSYHNALGRACAGAKVEHCTSNDLRRTFCHWMRQDGMPRELVAAAMGHGSTAMVDKVYGKLTADELGELMLRATRGTLVAHRNDASSHSAHSSHSRRTKKSLKSKGSMVGRERIELSTNGLKVQSLLLPKARPHKENSLKATPRGTPVAQLAEGAGFRRRVRGGR